MSDNASPKKVVLQGDPGSGKSMMACLTAVHPPVHVIDIDRKIRSAGWAQDALKRGLITVQEIAEPFLETNVTRYIKDMLGKEAPQMPAGWTKFTEVMYSLHKNDQALAAGTWLIDSTTLLNTHFMMHIGYIHKKSKFQFDAWAALQTGWMSTMSYCNDLAIEHGKDIIWTTHERDKEEPGDRTTGVKFVEQLTQEGVQYQKQYTGTQDLKVWASIMGGFGNMIGGQVDEYYHLFVKMEGDKPRWRCRVHPDGRRSLRTSFILDVSEHDPDFRKIWK